MQAKENRHNHNQHVTVTRSHRKTTGQRLADLVAQKAGSWSFIIGFFVFLIIWMALNSYIILMGIWDPYPFILLNLALSCLAAIQAPIILMSQNRAADIDRQRASKDYYVNRKAEKEIKLIQKDLIHIKGMILKQPKKKELEKIEQEIKKIQGDIEDETNAVYK